MKPAPATTDEAAERCRQLILAQVQLLELEDTCTDLTTRLRETEALLEEARKVGDRILAEHDRETAHRRQLEEQLNQTTTLAEEQAARITSLETTIGEMLASRSWRSTAPLRLIERVLNRGSR